MPRRLPGPPITTRAFQPGQRTTIRSLSSARMKPPRARPRAKPQRPYPPLRRAECHWAPAARLTASSPLRIVWKIMAIAESEAREQIQRVLESELFRASELQRRLLRYLAEKSLSGEADQLKEYTIGVEGLGKPESYDPRHDSSVRL